MDIARKLDRPKSLTDLAVEQMRASIVEGRLAFGEQLSEAVLAVKLGISKTPVREALLRLKLEGLVDIQPQRGTFVFRMTADEVHEICAFRELAECEALALAMRSDRRALLDRLQSILDEMAAPGAQARTKDFDTDFHESIIACCGNQYLQSAYGLIAFKMQALRARLPENDEKVDGCVDTHHAIVRHIAERRDAEGVEALRAHIRNTEDAYLQASEQPGVAAQRRSAE